MIGHRLRRLAAAAVALPWLAACGEETEDTEPRIAEPTRTPSVAPEPDQTPVPAGEVTIEWVAVLPAVEGGWSEGLDWHDGVLWQAFPGELLARDAMSGETLGSWRPPSGYSESLVWHQGRLWNVSYADDKIYAGTLDGDSLTFEVAGTAPDVHAWGIAAFGARLVLTGNGKEDLYFLAPDLSLEWVTTTPVDDLEDIEYHHGSIWASSYTTYPGSFFRLDPVTGDVLDVFDVPAPALCRIVDGIAVDDGDRLYVTGKECPAIWIGEIREHQ